ncbi:MAG: hypothetical protein ACI4QX_07555 [Lachnospiraceae bacterium]
MEHLENFQPNDNFSFRDNLRVTDAVIQSITTNRGTTFVTIEYDDCSSCRSKTQVTLVVGRNTVIRNERGRTIPAEDLETGMVIDAVFSQNMTRSIPPQAQAFQIRVKNAPPSFHTTEGRILEINTREQFIRTVSNRNPASVIRFNLSPETRIFDPIGRRISLSNLFPGLRVRVEHAAFMTASIPPQTTAFVIRVIR